MNGRDNRGRRRPFRRDGRNNDSSRQERFGHGSGHAQNGKNKGDFRLRKSGDKPDNDKKGSPIERTRWVAPKQSTEPLPALNCIRCGLPIANTHEALSDRKSGAPVHFDCVMSELSGQEALEMGDTLSYIGGGRFGIIHFNAGREDSKNFTIKKIFEWEDKEQRAEWRGVIADHYSLT